MRRFDDVILSKQASGVVYSEVEYFDFISLLISPSLPDITSPHS
jgi:hypothetical protein